MQQFLLIIHVLAAIAIIALVLVQHGKGADVGAAFGSGSANTMFGSAGHLSFLMKLTSFLAVIFFATSLSLSYLSLRGSKQANTLSNGGVQQQQQQEQQFPTMPTLPKQK